MQNKSFDEYFPQGTVTVLTPKEDCEILQIKNASGEGFMTIYHVFPGLTLFYNDFYMKHCKSAFTPTEALLCIDHCRDGSIGHKTDNGAYVYTKSGDLKVDHRRHHTGEMDLPLSQYHGITIAFSLEEASRSLPLQFKDFPVNLFDILAKYCDDEHPFVIQGEPCIEHIFSELYTVPEKIKIPYFKVKIFELLLYLDALELSNNKKERPYFYKTQVEKVKAIHDVMTENLEKHFTLEELSVKFDISLTSMKICFKSLYEDSVFSYMRTYRMNYAAGLLKQNKDINISDIAARVGYDSPGKFSTAFKSIMGNSPLAYRKSFV